ncbi:MAG TPA: DUF6516 family protein [Anaerolineae bacterium]|nr:DUF6516 family protein [Anaerolineae bacterium]HQK12747.1 DUF6516 family protein [Anaerolineae bacterium]
MLKIYQALVRLAFAEFSDIVVNTAFVGGTAASPNKLRFIFIDGSFLDVWLSQDNDYAYHWERRRQCGKMYRWDNAPHHPHVRTFPAHFHEGDELNVAESYLATKPECALREILTFVRQNL